jgi:hypothetical protein
MPHLEQRTHQASRKRHITNQTFALIPHESHRLSLANGAYEVSHTARAFDHDHGEIAFDCFHNVLQGAGSTANCKRNGSHIFARNKMQG